jgi:putative PIN family toxin of toxin-antitoxin system
MSFAHKRIIVDSNVLISAAIYPDSPAALAYATAALVGDLYASQDTLAEIERVLMRAKFDPYFTAGGPTRERFLSDYRQLVTIAQITQTVTDCPDPQDNQFLSLAVSIGADTIVSGDRKHLLPMHPYRGTAILSCDEFLRELEVRSKNKPGKT